MYIFKEDTKIRRTNLLPFGFPCFLSTQTPSKHTHNNNNNNNNENPQNHVYIQRTYQNKKKKYISLWFPMFSQHPNTKQSSKKKKKKKKRGEDGCCQSEREELKNKVSRVIKQTQNDVVLV